MLIVAVPEGFRGAGSSVQSPAAIPADCGYGSMEPVKDIRVE